MRYKIIDQRQQRVDKEVEKERRKFVYGAYIISTINVLFTLIVAFYLIKNDQFVDNAVKYTVIIFPIFTFIILCKKIYNKKLVTIYSEFILYIWNVSKRYIVWDDIGKLFSFYH